MLLLGACNSKQDKNTNQKITAWDHVKKREPFYTNGGTINWCNYYGKQDGNLKIGTEDIVQPGGHFRITRGDH